MEDKSIEPKNMLGNQHFWFYFLNFTIFEVCAQTLLTKWYKWVGDFLCLVKDAKATCTCPSFVFFTLVTLQPKTIQVFQFINLHPQCPWWRQRKGNGDFGRLRDLSNVNLLKNWGIKRWVQNHNKHVIGEVHMSYLMVHFWQIQHSLQVS